MLLTAALTLCQVTAAQAQVSDRRVRWHTLRTEHFEISYPEPTGAVARRAAFVAERAHDRLTAILGHDPSRRTQIVLRDDTDSANGSATPLPYNQIELFVTAPEDLTPLGDYDDWLSVLLTHEHTHVLHLDTIHGWPAVVNAILGKIYAPNLIQPRWFIEGLATHMESAETSGGRIRSSMFDMYMRMDVLEDRLLRIDQLSNSVDRWPRGTSWYLYGGRFVDWIAKEYGREALTAMSHEYGRRLIPYGINRTARRITGHTFLELYELWHQDLREHYGAMCQRIRREGLEEGERLTFHGEIVRAPRFVNPHTLVYFVNDGHNDPQLRLLDLETNETEQLTRVAGISYASAGHGGRTVVFDSLDGHRDIYLLYDLFAIDRNEGTVTRLTHGRRARAPDVAPDGRRVAFVQNSAGTTHLMVADLADVEGTAEVLLRSERFHQVFTPRWSPDGRTLAVSRWSRGGFRDVVLVDANTGAVRPITQDRAMDTGPAWAPDGRTVYFSSDRTGVANLYAYDLASGTLWQVTNVVSGAYSPAVSPDGRHLVYLGYSSRGFDLHRLDIDRSRWRPAHPYADERPPPVPTGAVAAPSQRYRALPTLYPRSYLVDFQPDAFGPQLGVNLAGQDIVGMHQYAARVGFSLTKGYVNAEVEYLYRRLPAPLSLRFFRTVAPRGGLEVGGEAREWIEDAIGADVGFSYRFRRALHTERVGASYSVAYLRKAEPFGGSLDPNTPPPVLPVTGRLATLRLSWTYSDARRHTYDMTPSMGRSLGLSASFAHSALGSNFNAASVSWSWTRYVEAPWAEHHVFSLRHGGGLSGGDLGHRGVFSVGGFPSANLIEGFRDGRTLGGVALRGYPPYHRRGTRFGLVQAEYRFPLHRWMAGPQTLPIYLNRSYASVFVDVGDAWTRTFDPKALRVGTGAEVFLDFTVGYVVPFTLRVGVAYGFMDDAGLQLYYHLGVPF